MNKKSIFYNLLINYSKFILKLAFANTLYKYICENYLLRNRYFFPM